MVGSITRRTFKNKRNISRAYKQSLSIANILEVTKESRNWALNTPWLAA
jgi:hypothetical protein